MFYFTFSLNFLDASDWWRSGDLNSGHADYDSAALTTELLRQFIDTRKVWNFPLKEGFFS